MGEITVSWQTLITLATVLGAAAAILKYYNKGYDFVKRQEEQDKIIKAIQEEQTLLTYGVLACLKGLHEQGANGPVTEAIDKIEKHINKRAHGG
jgi:Na+/H+ antiporter NhaD/arsenite permease-like protein